VIKKYSILCHFTTSKFCTASQFFYVAGQSLAEADFMQFLCVAFHRYTALGLSYTDLLTDNPSYNKFQEDCEPNMDAVMGQTLNWC